MMRQNNFSLKSRKSKGTSSLLSITFVVRFFAAVVGIATLGGNLSLFLLYSDNNDTPSAIATTSDKTDAAMKQTTTWNQNVLDIIPQERKSQIKEEPEDQETDIVLEEDEDPQEGNTPPPVSLKEGQERILAVFSDAGVELDNATLQSLPSWNEIVRNIGEAPRIYGLDRCENFRATVPAVQRMVGCCGMFNSGTNLLMRLMKENCKIPERIDYYGWNGTFEKWGMGPGDAHGMRWQVPWGKHTAAKYRDAHSTKKASDIVKESVLPIVAIRNPYVWMKSMCKSGYTAKWPHGPKCPHLVHSAASMTPTNLTVSYGRFEDSFDSLAHLWNGWYHQYWKEADYPFLMVRFEDLIFHAKNVTTQICHCAGGVIRTDRPFFHIVKSAKDGPGHGKKEERTDMVQAWIKYGNPLPVRGDFSRVDYKASRKFLDGKLMQTFGYKHPRPN